jgi:mannosylglycerate hydrolase
MPPRRVAIVPHTHWDREWYAPFQEFRLKLVDVLDDLLALLERDPSYRAFLLDGQLAVVDDYLEIRPENEERLRRLATSGRLTLGPWYILMDEFLVSAETIVRDLQLGLERAGAFGGAMTIGYLPDMFGHIAQMPQILAQAGFADAVVWRGVPSEITSTGFDWAAPDGSTVRAEYLVTGYGNGAELPDDAKALVRRVSAYDEQVHHFLIDGLLIMNGSDHLHPQPGLGRTVAEANELQDDYHLEITSLPDYLSTVERAGLQRHEGELRSGARSNVLMGVTSNRVDVKHAAALAEIALEHRAEPYSALFGPAERWPARLLEVAWKQVVRNVAHDSICACSADDVVDAVLHRFAEARQIGDGLAQAALDAFAASMTAAGPVVVNPVARTRQGVIEAVIAGSEPGPNEQVISQRSALPGTMTLDAGAVQAVLGLLQGTRISDGAWVHDVRIEEDAAGIDVTVLVGDTELAGVPITALKENLGARLSERPGASVRITLDQPPVRRVATRVEAIAGLGWGPVQAARLDHPASVAVVGTDPDAAGGPAGSAVLRNGLVTVVVDARDGTFSIDGLAGYGRLVDGGDLGDSYNYSPPSEDRFVDAPSSVAVEVLERGPVRVSAVLTARYDWPQRIEHPGTRVGRCDVEVTTKIELHADDPLVRVTTAFVNPARDHRLRVHFPLPEPAAESEAESAFGTVRRGLEIEGRAEERGLPTFPARRFVRAGRLTVCHLGVHEYELVDVEPGPDGARAHALALTLLRSTGLLSGVGMTYRPVPAGPLLEVEGLQMVGTRVETRYALAVDAADPFDLAEDFLTPLEVVESLGGGTRPAAGSHLSVEGARISALRREAGALEIRVYNPTEAAATVRLATAAGWLVDLRGRPLEPFEGGFVLRPFGFATARVTHA